MIYRFIDAYGTYVIDNPQRFPLYFPLTDAAGSLLSSISPNLSGDIKRDNERFLTVPASAEDLRSSPLCRREFFLRAAGATIRLSEPCAREQLEAGLLYQKLTKRCRGLEIEVLNFIPHAVGAEVMRVRVRNISSAAIPLSAVSFVPLYGRSEKNLRDHRHVSSLLNRVFLSKSGITLCPSMVFDEKGHRVNRTRYFARGYEGQGTAFAGQYPTLDSFFGSGDILDPDAVAKDLPAFEKKLDRFDGKEACAAFRFGRKRLLPGRSREFTLVLGIGESDAQVEALWRRLDRPAKVEAALAATRCYWREYLSGVRFDFGDADINGWLTWVTLQPTLRKLFGCSFLPHFDYGKGGRGWRDLWQDALALLMTEPEKAGQIICQSFRGVRVDGSNATIITGDGNFIADRNKINRVWMDHGIWPYLTTRLYINRTGDPDFLLTGQTYFRDHQLSRARRVDTGFRQKDFLLRDGKGRVVSGSILEHILVQNLVQFFNVGRHNIVRLENADWNDGMDMAADKGESVAFSFMYVHTLGDLIGLLEVIREKRRSVPLMEELLLLLDRARGARVDYGDYRQKQKRLEAYFGRTATVSGRKVEVPLDLLIDDLRQKWEHGTAWLSRKEWLARGFFNGYYDNDGRRVEGVAGGKTRMTLTGQVFAIMSGVADEKQIKAVWRSLNRYLKDAAHAGYRLNTDFGAIQMKLGRAFGFSYGDKENGAFFNHMAVMLAYALYTRGFVKEGARVFSSIRAMAMSDRGLLPPVLPEYFNSEGRGLYLYLTGSASWYLYTLTQEVLGIKFLLGDLLIEPKLLPSDLPGGYLEANLICNGKKLRVRYTRPKSFVEKPLTVRRVVCGGREVASAGGKFLIKTAGLSAGTNLISVTLG